MYQIIVDATGYTGATKKALVSVNRDATTKTGANYTSLVTAFDAYLVNPAQAPVPVNWQISFTGSTGGSTNTHEIGNLKICAQTVIPPTGSSNAAGFNAIDSALPNTKQNALFGHIYMKLAGVPFKLNVAALAPPVGGVSQGVNTAYASGGNKTVIVNLIDDSQAGGSCNASSSACSACAKTVVASQTMTFSSGDAGFKTSANFTLPVPPLTNAYKRLIAQMVDSSTTPATYGCSTDAFSVRPTWYALTSSVTAPTKAGTTFTITATPQNINGTTLTATTGSPAFDNSKAPTVGGTQTLLWQQPWNAGASFGNFIYNDVGSFTLPANAIYDSSFGNATGEAQDQLNGDCNPGSGSNPYTPLICYGYSGATCNNASPYNPNSSGKYSCDIGSLASPSIGRFYPDHYEASVAATQGCSANGFTYMGQPFSMTAAVAGAIQIKALAAGQAFATAPGLPSYTGGYTPRANVWFGAQNGTGSTTDLIKCISSTQNASPNRCNATTLPFKTSASNAWTAGVYTAPATTFYFDPPKDTQSTPDSTWGPYDSLNVGVFVSDSDGSTLTIPTGQSFTLNGDLYQAVNGSTPMKERYGRMRIQNTAGSDQVPLAVPVWLEYWAGSAWMPNPLDTSCTTLAAAPTPFGGNTASKACFGTCTSTTAGGVGSIYNSQIKTVGANAVTPSYSSTQFSFGLRNVILSAPKASGMIGISIEAPTWLEIGPNDPTGADPVATVRFGTYNSRFIFLRENY
jgi:MSHA biogenesis protein MshQ